MTSQTSRREFLQHSVSASVAFWVAGQTGPAVAKSPNEKLNIAVIGPGGRGASNLAGVKGENIVALCDVDERRGGRAFEQYPNAKRFKDYRRLLDEMDGVIEAVVVSTPDHVHVPASVEAMKRGKHVYCEKPLSHSVFEARIAARTAAEHGVVTQMGTQIHAGENYRRVVEIIQAGSIGPVRECHVWVGKVWGGGERPQETPPAPATLDWDLWLGPAPERPYHPTYVPAGWRRWWDFGNGTLGDMACHYMDLPFWALKLRHPTTVAAEGPPVHPETCPTGLAVHYRFPERDGLPAVNLTWYDGDRCPKELHGRQLPGSGVLFVGDNGLLLAGYSSYKLLPEDKFEGFERPEPTIPRSIGHHREWIEACKTGGPTTCNFDYSGALTEAVLLGSVAYRSGERLEWDAESLQAKNCPLANEFLRREYRNGWAL